MAEDMDMANREALLSKMIQDPIGAYLAINDAMYLAGQDVEKAETQRDELLAACKAGVIAERAYNNYKIDPRLENLTSWRKLADQAQRMRRTAIAQAKGTQ